MALSETLSETSICNQALGRIGSLRIEGNVETEIDISTLDTTINDDVIGDDGDTLESLSDQMDALSAQGSRVLNRYPTRNQPDG